MIIKLFVIFLSSLYFNCQCQINCKICFFGLIKQFPNVVYPSIKNHILNKNKKCEIYAHTYNLNETTNPRNQEKHELLNYNDIFLLTKNKKNIMIEDINNIKTILNASYLGKNGYPWTYNSISVINLIYMWNSIQKCWNIMMKNNNNNNTNISYIIFSRMDSVYKTDIFIENELPIANNTVYVPKWGSWINSVNDRFAFGDLNGMYYWSHRFKDAIKYVIDKGHQPHSETFLKFLLISHNVHIKFMTNFCFHTIRANGKIGYAQC